MTRRRRKEGLAALAQQIRAWLQGVGRRQKRLPDPLALAASAAAMPSRSASAPLSATVDRQRDTRIAERSRALAIRLFGANQPVENPRDLFGRARELDLLCTSVIDSGMHAVIFGPRGSGKTSLVRVFGDLADQRGATVLYQSCAGGSGFGDLVLPYLDDLDASTFGMTEDDFADAVAALRDLPTPRAFASLLVRASRDDLILILDEFDRLDAETKAQLALLVKLLSDMRARARIVCVGISSDVAELIDVHASVRRHLVPVGLSPLDDGEVESFIDTTSRAIGLTVLSPALSLLRWLVCGSPYHMRLFSLHTCLHAIEHDRRYADEHAVLSGSSRALAIWRGTNARDHALFETLVTRSDFSARAIEEVARLAATKLEFTINDVNEVLRIIDAEEVAAEALVSALTPALARLQDNEMCLVFEDVLAPQFLLAMSAAARLTSQHDTLAPEGTMQ
ncbi:ATP-binding protein [Novosphingobium sp. 9U]|uniref:ATP-binding protein n=1 Tax=Novosphingobium sp. 9U TaxID=2653158 RepID=UPI0012EF7821|nr:ATP-binding protein [Novosphingobium sp. 9U]VWX53326.1 ATP-binding protein [Novosphingobium sp. 9U]